MNAANLKIVESPADNRPTIQYIDPALLKIDERYQRALDEKRIAQWSREGFDWMKFGVLTANLRDDGQLYVENGQHRLALALHDGKSPVPVQFSVDETPEHEAEMFIDINTSTRPIKATGRFIARRFSGDPLAQALDTVIQEAGFHVAPTTEPTFDAINAVAVLENIAEFAGVEGIGNALWAISSAWKDKPKQRSVRGAVLRGVHWLYFNHVPFDLREGEATAILSALSQDELLIRAKTRQNQLNRASSTADALYRELVDEANKGRRNKILYAPMRLMHLEASEVADIKKRFQAGQEIPAIAKKLGFGAGIVSHALKGD